jgi:hypothetical protein
MLVGFDLSLTVGRGGEKGRERIHSITGQATMIMGTFGHGIGY